MQTETTWLVNNLIWFGCILNELKARLIQTTFRLYSSLIELPFETLTRELNQLNIAQCLLKDHKDFRMYKGFAVANLVKAES